MKSLSILLPLSVATFLCIGLPSCQKENMEEMTDNYSVPENTNVYGSIQVSVVWCNLQNDPFCEDITPITGALVTLYNSEEDRTYNEPIKAEKVTSATGKVTFSQLEGGKRYYIRTNCIHGVRESDDTTPTNGLAFHEVIFTQ